MSTVIKLPTDKQPVPLRFSEKARDGLLQVISGEAQYQTVKDEKGRDKYVRIPKPLVRNNLPEAAIYHRNYLQYLESAWANHYGVVMAPHLFWNEILCELAQHIKGNAERYAQHFTKTPGTKQDLVVQSADMEVMPLDRLMDAIKDAVPASTHLFMPEFSTSTMQSRFALYAAFADAVSPYYNYGMLLCDIPKVRLEGTAADWELVANNLQELTILDLARPYLDTVTALAKDIRQQLDTPDPDFWVNMFKLIKCGSGHQVEVEGWIRKLYFKQPSMAYTENFASHISKVSYTQLNTQKKYNLYYGLFSSLIDVNDFLVPEFSYSVEAVE